ncbi:hypothetical protein JCM17960_07810 [Magnetospira thiophila]
MADQNNTGDKQAWVDIYDVSPWASKQPPLSRSANIPKLSRRRSVADLPEGTEGQESPWIEQQADAPEAVEAEPAPQPTVPDTPNMDIPWVSSEPPATEEVPVAAVAPQERVTEESDTEQEEADAEQEEAVAEALAPVEPSAEAPAPAVQAPAPAVQAKVVVEPRPYPIPEQPETPSVDVAPEEIEEVEPQAQPVESQVDPVAEAPQDVVDDEDRTEDPDDNDDEVTMAKDIQTQPESVEPSKPEEETDMGDEIVAQSVANLRKKLAEDVGNDTLRKMIYEKEGVLPSEGNPWQTTEESGNTASGNSINEARAMTTAGAIPVEGFMGGVVNLARNGALTTFNFTKGAVTGFGSNLTYGASELVKDGKMLGLGVAGLGMTAGTEFVTCLKVGATEIAKDSKGLVGNVTHLFAKKKAAPEAATAVAPEDVTVEESTTEDIVVDASTEESDETTA